MRENCKLLQRLYALKQSFGLFYKVLLSYLDLKIIFEAYCLMQEIEIIQKNLLEEIKSSSASKFSIIYIAFILSFNNGSGCYNMGTFFFF